MINNKFLATLVVGAALCAAQNVGAQSAKPAVAAKPTIAVGEPNPTAHRLPAHPAQPPQVDAVFNAWDTDHNGSLSKQEFIAGSQQLRRESAVAQQLRAQFRTLDADKSGALDAHEYAQMQLIKRAGASAPSFSSFDANKNGRLEFAEYVAVVRQLATAKSATAAPAKKP
jgi:hypothetical protein